MLAAPLESMSVCMPLYVPSQVESILSQSASPGGSKCLWPKVGVALIKKTNQSRRIMCFKLGAMEGGRSLSWFVLYTIKRSGLTI